MVTGVRAPTADTLVTAFAVGLLVYIPALCLLGLILPGLAWFALFGLAVPAAVAERLGFVDALRRGLELGRADFVHALGTLCTLGLLVFLTGQVMIFVIYGASGQAIRSPPSSRRSCSRRSSSSARPSSTTTRLREPQ